MLLILKINVSINIYLYVMASFSKSYELSEGIKIEEKFYFDFVKPNT